MKKACTRRIGTRTRHTCFWDDGCRVALSPTGRTISQNNLSCSSSNRMKLCLLHAFSPAIAAAKESMRSKMLSIWPDSGAGRVPCSRPEPKTHCGPHRSTIMHISVPGSYKANLRKVHDPVRLAQRRANNSGELLEDQDDHLWTRHVKVSSESEKSLLRSHEPSNEASMGERELQALKLFRTIGPGQIDVHLICPDQHFLQRPLRSANNSAMVWPARRVALVRAYKSQCSSQKQ